MSPPAILAESVQGGSATPSKNELIEVGRAWLDHYSIQFGNSRLFRAAIEFKAKCPRADRWLFLQYLCGQLQIGLDWLEETRRGDPDFYQPYAHMDLVGEEAVAAVTVGRPVRAVVARSGQPRLLTA